MAGFNIDYLIDLVTRFTNWQMIGAISVLFMARLSLSQWIHITVFMAIILLWLNVLTLAGPSFSLWPAGQPTTTVAATGGDAAATATTTGGAPVVGDIPVQTTPSTTVDLNAWLNNFYNAEAKRRSIFPSSLPADAQLFELLVINTCSLSWSDIEAAGLMSHPLWSHFDTEFKNFNSATSCSGPVAIRLLRASCEQTSHTNLHQSANNDYYLSDNLPKLGFTQYLMMGRNGQFGGFLKEVRGSSGMQSELVDQANLSVTLLGFNGLSVYDDTAMLNRQLDVTEKDKSSRSAMFYDTPPLHDDNHCPGVSKTTDYRAQAQKFFDELNAFFTELGKLGRKVMVIMVLGHGGALKGDKMQVPGLRDILSPSITGVLVGVKFFGMRTPYQGAPIVIDQPSNFLVISDLMVRVLDDKVPSEDNVDWKKLTSGLPRTAPVSENSNTVTV